MPPYIYTVPLEWIEYGVDGDLSPILVQSIFYLFEETISPDILVPASIKRQVYVLRARERSGMTVLRDVRILYI